MREFLRQTMIALRSRRQAYRIAADFLYDVPIDTESFMCRKCGRELTGELITSTGWVVCPACHSFNRAPQHVRSRSRSKIPRAAEPTVDPEPWSLRDLQPELPVLSIIFLLIIVVAALVLLVASTQR